MRKIVSLFQRNYDGDRLVRDEIVPGAEWVAFGEGVATRKWDGTCVMIRDGLLWKRYDAKKGRKQPDGFEPAQEQPDAVTGHWPGWLPVGEGPEDRWHRAARLDGLPDGTYELIGPMINRNPEASDRHRLVAHGTDELMAPRDFAGLREFLSTNGIEGIVWHHPDGRMVKIKASDFGVGRGRTHTKRR